MAGRRRQMAGHLALDQQKQQRPHRENHHRLPQHRPKKAVEHGLNDLRRADLQIKRPHGRILRSVRQRDAAIAGIRLPLAPFGNQRLAIKDRRINDAGMVGQPFKLGVQLLAVEIPQAGGDCRDLGKPDFRQLLADVIHPLAILKPGLQGRQQNRQGGAKKDDLPNQPAAGRRRDCLGGTAHSVPPWPASRPWSSQA